MSRVFIAREVALDRPVVVKVLAPELAASVSAGRFAREIRLAAHLQQANIVPLLVAGEITPDRPGEPAIPYYTMPLVQGESLRRRLTTGEPIPIGTVVHILHDVARALAYAHEQGVVHRDIKPENVLLSGDTAVVTDFGIARALSESRTIAESETLTAVGAVVGTPQYMAPEQLTGQATLDHRVDLYALGCLGYELVAGRSPFHGMTGQKLFVAHMTETPVPLESVRADVPPPLAGLIFRCMAKDPAQRPQSAREVLTALDHVATPRAETTVPLAAHSLGRPAKARWLIGAVAIVAVAMLVAFWPRAGNGGDAAEAVHLVVMPFTNVGGDPAQEYFAEGMTISLTDALSRVPGLQVTARSLAATYRGKTIDVRRLGEELGVNVVLEGTVQRVGERLRVTSQLTSAANGVARWSNNYQRQIEDLFAVQDSITQAIVAELRGQLAGPAPGTAPGHVAGTTNLDAYDRYIRGVLLLERRGAGVAQSVDLFSQAIELDSAFAPAHARLSEALELLPYFTETPASLVEERAIDAARRALALDSTIAEAHVGLALAYGHANRWAESEAQFRLALADDSLSAVAHMQYGRHLMHLGRFTEAIPHFRVASQLEPLAGTSVVWLAHNYALIGQMDSAAVIARRARGIDPGLLLTRTFTALDLAWAGHADEARDLLANLNATPPWMGQAAIAYSTIGDTAAAQRILAQLDKLPRDTWLIHTGSAYARLAVGDTSRALDELQAAVAAREITPKWFSLADRVYDPIRSHPRFAAVVRGFGLDVARMTIPSTAR